MEIKNIELIMLAALMIGIYYILVFVAVLLDLISGLKKAKQRGEATLSEALRRTSDKLGRYYLPLMGLTVADIAQIVGIWLLDTYWSYSIPIFPLCTMVGSIGICAIEIKSILEKADDKAKYIRVGKLSKDLLKNKDSADKIVGIVVDYLKEQEDENEITNKGISE